MKIIYKLLEISELLDDLKNISGNDKIKRTNEGYEICKRIGDVGYDLFQLDEQIVYFGNAYKFKRYLKQSISTIQDSLGSLSEQEIVISNINTLFPDKDEKFIQKTILIKKREICIRLYVFNTEFLKRNIFSLLENIKVPMKLSDLSAFSDRISDETLRENFSTDIEEMENNVAQFDNLFSVNAEVGKKHKAKRSINPR